MTMDTSVRQYIKIEVLVYLFFLDETKNLKMKIIIN